MHSDSARPADALADTVAWLMCVEALTAADGERLPEAVRYAVGDLVVIAAGGAFGTLPTRK